MNPFEVYNSKFSQSKSHPNISWEESAAQSPEHEEDFFEGSAEGNTKLFSWALLIIFLVVVFRLGSLQLAKGSQYRAMAEDNRIREKVILAPRGLIYDSQGQSLVENIPGFELTATPTDLPENYEQEVKDLAALFGFDVNEALGAIKKVDKNSFQSIAIAQNVSHDNVLVFESQISKFPGFQIEKNPIREYKDPQIFSHLVGYTGKINDTELASHKDQDYLLNDFIGKTGLEFSYENYLRGKNGEDQVEVDARGQQQQDLGIVEPKAGQSLHLNIDADLQKEIYNQIEKYNGNKKAAAIALNPQTGQVLALISVPGYDTNKFSRGISQADYQALLNNPQNPLLNRAIGGTYPPGSTIKPVIASAALQEKVVTPSTIIYDNGDLVYGGFHFHGWKLSGLGPMDVRSAIAMSSDIYFYTVGGGQAALNIEGLGPERLNKYDYLFGMGAKTGIDLPGEKAGIVGGPEWRKATYKDPANQIWYPGDTYHISIGQGDMLATPLQVAIWTSIVANGGTYYKPYIVDSVTDGDNKVILKNQPQVVRAGFIDPENIEVVRQGMRQTVTAGTARSLSVLRVSAAGKTGTAQFDGANPSATHAWFTAFAPYDNPQIVITVLIEAGGEGSTAASPVVRETLKWWQDHRWNGK